MAVFYTDKPVFGFDIGHSSIKIMQINNSAKKTKVIGYGTSLFDPAAVDPQGMIVDPEALIKTAHKLISSQLVGKITTKRVAVSLPNANSFSRVLILPAMSSKELKASVQAEVDQSIPLPADELYYDYSVARVLDNGKHEIQIIDIGRAHD